MVKCEYYYTNLCTYQAGNSQTCLNGGGRYCGKWRELKEKENINNG